MNKIIYKGIMFSEPNFINCAENRNKTAKAMKSKVIMKQPCEVCGSADSIAHHENYDDYLNVRWLCYVCHSTIHHIFRTLNPDAFNKDKSINTTSLKIDFQKIIKESEAPVTKAKLARDMVAKGIFKNQISAYNMIQFHERGEAKSIDYELLQYLMERFKLTASQIIQ